MLTRFVTILRPHIQWQNSMKKLSTTSATGAILPRPERTSFGMVRVCLAVVPGLLIGATISKYMANFLEENELFVPSDDDDDDD